MENKQACLTCRHPKPCLLAGKCLACRMTISIADSAVERRAQSAKRGLIAGYESTGRIIPYVETKKQRNSEQKPSFRLFPVECQQQTHLRSDCWSKQPEPDPAAQSSENYATSKWKFEDRVERTISSRSEQYRLVKNSGYELTPEADRRIKEQVEQRLNTGLNIFSQIKQQIQEIKRQLSLLVRQPRTLQYRFCGMCGRQGSFRDAVCKSCS